MKLTFLGILLGILINSTSLTAQIRLMDDVSYNLVDSSICAKPILKKCNLDDNPKPWNCTLEAIGQEILRTLKYPGIALENGREGSVLIELRINEIGEVIECNTLHHFEQNSDKALEKLYRKSKLTDLSFEAVNCLKEKELISLRIPVTFYLENKNVPFLWDMEQVFCERSTHFEIQQVKLNKFKKYLKQSPSINEMWLYKYNLVALESLGIDLSRNDEIVKSWNDLKDIKVSELTGFADVIRKGDIIIFRIYEQIKDQNRMFTKKVIIK